MTLMPSKALKWHAKQLVRHLAPEPIKRWLLGIESPAYHLWSIGTAIGRSPFQLARDRSMDRPVLTREDVTDVRALFVADPFMIRVHDLWHMFFEVYNYDSDRGEIGWATSCDGRVWNYEQIVLRESFHLSYPYVFEWNGCHYMVPESHQARSVRLYEAKQFPTEWVCTDVLLKGECFNDSSLFRYGQHWWMLSETSSELRHDTLRLYYSRHLRCGWQEHSRSPIIQANPHTARPAGRVRVVGDKLIRFAQDCSPIYGTSVRAFEITDLTPVTYEERVLLAQPFLGPNWRPWMQGGMHHIDLHHLGTNQWIACMDGWRPVGGLVPEAWQAAKC